MIYNNIDNIFKPISTLTKLSEKTIKNLADINISRIIDALLYFPSSIKNRKGCKSALELEVDKICIITLKVLEHKIFAKSRLNIVCEDILGNIVIINYFRYLKFTKNYYPINKYVTVSGLCTKFGGNFSINHPEKVIKSPPFSQELEDNQHLSQILYTQESVYKGHQGLSSSVINNLILKSLEVLQHTNIPEWYGVDFLNENNLPSFKEAILQLHNPAIENKKQALLRVALDELLSYHINLQKVKQASQEIPGINLKSNNSLCKTMIKNIPFTLTTSQQQAFADIKKYLGTPSKSTILLQGDVGSGKSIVLFLTALVAIENSYQVAILTPTGVLAKQHYNNLVQYCQNIDVNIGLLLGGAKKSEKNNIIKNLSNGNLHILIATHAILNDDINFNNLGLIIIDEQHKFGVSQRLKLTKKGNNPNILLATATPIPRTLILAHYGDIDVVNIKEKPKNRKEIITTTLSIKKLDTLMNKTALLITKGEKIFWVCALVKDSEGFSLTSIEERSSWIKKEYPNLKVFILHGKLTYKQKEQILEDFIQYSQGAILLTTTVIEVGIDIPQCNILIIEDSQNLGLAQLHQLRGRVGRGSMQGYCILLYSSPLGKTAEKRLLAMRESVDGFYLAEQDLKIRGYGDVLGTYQSGFEYFIAYNIKEHYQYLHPIMDLAKLFLQQYNQNINKVENKYKFINLLELIFLKSNVEDYFYNG